MKDGRNLWFGLREKSTGVAIFSFRGNELIPPHGLDLDLGDTVLITEECGDWYRGYVKSRRGKYGIFPSSYIKLKQCSLSPSGITGGGNSSCSTISTRSSVTSNNSDKDKEPSSALNQLKLEDSVVQEIALIVREWGEIWKRLYMEGGSSAYQFDVIHRGIRELVDGRKQLITGTLTQDQLRELKLKLTRKIDWGNRRLGLDLIPRVGYEKINPDELGAVELYQVHVRSVENAEAIRGSGTLKKKRKSVRLPSHRALGYHLFLSVRDFSYQLNDDCEIYFSLYDGARSQFITERFMVKFTREGMSNFVDKLQCAGLTLFEDLGYTDLTKDLYLVVQVVRIGRMSYSESNSTKKSNQLYKRPFAAGVLNISDIVNPNVVKGSSYGDNSSLKSGLGGGGGGVGESYSDIPILIGGGGSTGHGNNYSHHPHGDNISLDDFSCSTTALNTANNSILDEDRELSFKLYTCDEKDFWQLHDLLVKKQMNKVSLVSGHNTNYSVVVTLKLLSGDLTHVRIENPLLFGAKSCLNSITSIVTTKKLGFPDVIMPGDVRNDLYLILESGEFEKSGKTHGKNIEVSIMVFDSSNNSETGPSSTDKDKGQVAPSSYIHVSNGTGGQEEYQSVILYHHNCPKWYETIRLSVPIEKFPTAHIRIEYRHCSTKEKNDKKLFGFSFVKLMDEEGTTLKDGAHELYVYKCEDRNKLRDPKSYLHLPSLVVSNNLSSSQSSTATTSSALVSSTNNSNNTSSNSLSSQSHSSAIIGNQTFQRSAKEVLNISTLLVSTKLTQNMDLVSLLKWKSHPEKVRETLKNMAQLSGEEIVKFLQDVLDVLFAMFLSEDGESNDFSGNVFIVLVNIFSLLEDVKYEHFKPVIDQYIMNHFAAALVYKGLLSSVRHYAEVAHSAPKESHAQIQKCFETLEFTFKFIIQSHILFTRATGGEVKDSLVRDVQLLFGALTNMLSHCSSCSSSSAAVSSSSNSTTHAEADFIPIQAALLYNLSKMYTELLRVLPSLEITRLLTTLFSSIELKDSIHPLSPAKLTAIHHLVRSSLFADKECRALVLPEICKHLRHHLTIREELKLCTDVIGDILTFLYSKRSCSVDNLSQVHDDVEIVATTTLEMLVQCVLVLERRSTIVANLVACMIGLLQLMDQFHYNRLWDEFGERKPLKNLLYRIFLVFRDLVKQDVYPTDWLIMKLVTDSIILKSLSEFAQPLILYFLNKYCFDQELWTQYFTLAVTFTTQPGLQLEGFRSSKCDEIKGRYGDMRVSMGFQILSMWSHLGENKTSFIPGMVGPFLEITLVPELELRTGTLPIFYDMLDVEQKYYGNFKQVEGELIDKLDVLISDDKGDDEYRQLFNTILLQRLEDCAPAWKSSGIAFINSVTRLLERLLDYRNVLQGDENRDKRMSCTVNLLNFYQIEVNRREMYLRYIYKLHDLHLSTENYIEAGFTLLLHSRMLSWEPSDEKHPAEYAYGAQTELERKETIYLKIINYFDAGKLWENGIPLCKELAEIYENQQFDYGKLSQLLKTQATSFENILTQLRPEPEYFRVGFFGKRFPLFVRNKEFIYRGLAYERLGAFIQRLLIEWPTAEILKNTPPDESILNSDGQYIQICSAKPKPNTKNPMFNEAQGPHRRHIAEPIQSYYNVNNINTFQYDRRLPKLIPDCSSASIDGEPENEFKHMWIERTTLTISDPLPGILRWFEVLHKHVEELTPIRFACEKMDDVNRQLNTLVGQYVVEPGRNVNPLSMRLQGILDAAVMGGLPKYREAFFSPEFIDGAGPESLGYVGKLYSSILEQVNILENGLAIHGRLAPSGVQPLHKRLLECFSLMKSTVQNDFNVSPATKTKFQLLRSDSQRDSFRKTTGGSSSIVYTPLPPVPRQQQLVKKQLSSLDHSSLSTSNRSSNSSGYGHLVGTMFDEADQATPALNHHRSGVTVVAASDDDDEDFYAKPDETKVHQILTNATKSAAFHQDMIDSSSALYSASTPTSAGGTPPSAPPPPIPNRNTKRQTPSHYKGLETTTTATLTSTPPKYNNSTPTEYILMPPGRLRELSSAGPDSLASPMDILCSPTNANANLTANDSFYTVDGSPLQTFALVHDGPPLPPKQSTITDAAANPPQLPKRHPKSAATSENNKPLLTPMSSFASVSSSGCASASQLYSQPTTTPLSPTKSAAVATTPPPVPPKPKSNSSSNSNSNSLAEVYETCAAAAAAAGSGATPTSPSYEERFEQGAVLLTDTLHSNGGVANSSISCPTTTTCNSNVRISSTSTTSSESGTSLERRRSNKEYYELPVMTKSDKPKQALLPVHTSGSTTTADDGSTQVTSGGNSSANEEISSQTSSSTSTSTLPSSSMINQR